MANKDSIVEILKKKMIPNLGTSYEDVAEELIIHVGETAYVTEAVDFVAAFSKYKKTLFPEYSDLRDFIKSTSEEKWTAVDIESALYTLDSGREIKKDSFSISRDPDNYFQYIVTGVKNKLVDADGAFVELLLFAGKNGNPLKYLQD